jgi:2-desacetyl-2-hydroxyethyl bacteriochlorophyllide A dehydrogenase
MKAALLTGPENIVLDDIADPPLAEDEVMIQPAYAGICGTDISFYLGHRIVPYPFVLGHEVTGSIVAVGAGVSKFSEGQRVVVEPNYPCGTCPLCLKGRGAVCAQKASMGVNLPGCFAEYCIAPAEFVWSLPETISDRDAATIEPLTVSMHALLQSGAKADDTIAVLGCGVVGLLLIHSAVAMGLRVVAHDRIESKLEMAKNLGAIAVDKLDDPGPLWQKENVSAAFECAGASATVETALKAAPRGAKVILLGLPSEPASFVPMRLVREGIDILTSMIYDHPADFARAIDLVSKGTIHPARVVTDTFNFESVGEGLELARTGRAGKIHIKWK